MSSLNSPQREAISYIDGPLLVLAGAGSGKTRVIIEKIAYLIQHCGHPAKRITAVTFTNKAAQEMTQRVRANLGERAKGLKISTFHALGLNIIRAELEALKLKRGFSIFDAQDSLALLQDLALQNRLTDAEITSTCQHLISQWKNDLLAPEQISQLASNGVEQQVAALYAQYERSLQAYNAVDIVPCEPSRFLNELPEQYILWSAKTALSPEQNKARGEQTMDSLKALFD